MENEIIPVRETVEVEVKRREEPQKEYEWQVFSPGSILLDEALKAMAKPRR